MPSAISSTRVGELELGMGGPWGRTSLDPFAARATARRAGTLGDLDVPGRVPAPAPQGQVRRAARRPEVLHGLGDQRRHAALREPRADARHAIAPGARAPEPAEALRAALSAAEGAAVVEHAERRALDEPSVVVAQVAQRPAIAREPQGGDD